MDLLDAVIDGGASDLHLQSGSPPQLRIGGTLTPMEVEPLTGDQIREYVRSMAYEEAQVRLEEDRSTDWEFTISWDVELVQPSKARQAKPAGESTPEPPDEPAPAAPDTEAAPTLSQAPTNAADAPASSGSSKEASL